MSNFKKRGELPNFVKLNYTFNIKKILEEVSLFAKNETDDLRPKGSYGDLVGGRSEELQKTFGLKFRSIEEAYEFLQKNDVNESELTSGLPQERRMTWDFRNYVKPFEKYIQKGADGKYKITGSPYKQIAITQYNENSANRHYEVSIPKSRLDERHYNKIKNWAKGSYIEEVLNTFKGSVHRARIAIMEPGAFVGAHIDYNTDYSVRYHIPLITNSECGFYVKRKGSSPEYMHMPADGSAWFLNQGWLHSAWNKGEEPRSHLIISVYGQDDLVGLYEN